jgi:hypothetical protein
MIDLVQAMHLIQIGRKQDFYHTTRCLLVHSREDIPLFDQAFEMFWQRPVEEWGSLDLGKLLKKNRRPRPKIVPPPLEPPPMGDTPPEGSDPSPQAPPLIEVTQTYSAREILRHKDFSELSGEELEEIKQMMTELMLEFGQRRTRRRKPGRGDLLDLRRTIRHSIKHGGEILLWARRTPKHKPRPLVILADISGSMERYARLLLHFIYTLTQALHQPVEAFVFSTRLTRITRQLHHKEVEQALLEVSRAVPDWSGGTRIGEALKSFNFIWGRRVLGRGAVVMLISDGWDRGDIELLRREIARLQRSCHRLIWLNPLLGSPEYEPLTRGMQAALPFVDDFLPVHNLSSLEDLAEHLAKLE